MKYVALFAFVLTMFGAMAVPSTQALAWGGGCGWHQRWIPGHWAWRWNHRVWIPGHCV